MHSTTTLCQRLVRKHVIILRMALPGVLAPMVVSFRPTTSHNISLSFRFAQEVDAHSQNTWGGNGLHYASLTPQSLQLHVIGPTSAQSSARTAGMPNRIAKLLASRKRAGTVASEDSGFDDGHTPLAPPTFSWVQLQSGPSSPTATLSGFSTYSAPASYAGEHLQSIRGVCGRKFLLSVWLMMQRRAR